MERGSRDPGIKLHCFGQSASLLGHTSGYILVDMRLFQVWEVLEYRSEVLEHRSEVLELGTQGVLTPPETGVSTRANT